ncbi:hypothetical protein ANCCAN_09094 [Ancylostoma caninum]|uniref:Uncharacterized protein n=1 Tax=Ancylostoma caninum TaxID=29170 RepID=A0A368GMN8_ANCCA|nr:hypothetical protein ANCCAN_09094 [Ancylostoma caninum]
MMSSFDRLSVEDMRAGTADGGIGQQQIMTLSELHGHSVKVSSAGRIAARPFHIRRLEGRYHDLTRQGRWSRAGADVSTCQQISRRREEQRSAATVGVKTTGLIQRQRGTFSVNGITHRAAMPSRQCTTPEQSVKGNFFGNAWREQC